MFWRTVDLFQSPCTCRIWNGANFSSIHAMILCNQTGRHIMGFIHDYDTIDHWIFQYSDLAEYKVVSKSSREFERHESMLLPLATMPRRGLPLTCRHRGAL